MLRRILPLPILATVLAAGEAPIVTIAAPDVARSVDRIERGVWGRVAAATARDGFGAYAATAARMADEGLGIDLLATLRATRAVDTSLDGVGLDPDGGAIVDFRGQAEMGATARPLAEALARALDARIRPATVAGSPAAWSLPTGVVDGSRTVFAVFGTHLVAGGERSRLDPRPVQAGDDDLVMVFNQPRLADGWRKILPGAEWAGQRSAMESLLGMLVWRLKAVPEGIEETIGWPGARTGLPVDRDLMARMPADALMAWCAGTDGAALWKAWGEALTGEPSGMPGSGSLVGLEAWMRRRGAPCTLEEAVASLRGTWGLAVSPGVPFPEVELMIPRNPTLDRLAVWLGSLNGATGIPAEGPWPLSIDGLPMAFQLVADRTHWLITPDPLRAETWPTGAATGFATRPAAIAAMARAPQEATGLGCSDTPEVLKVLGAYSRLLPIRDRKARTVLDRTVAELARAATTGWVWTRSTATGAEIRLRGVAGSGLIVPLAWQVVQGSAEAVAAAKAERPAAFLRRSLLPAVERARAAQQVDRDGDGIGEVPTMAQLVAAGIPGLAAPVLRDGDLVRDGYRYRLHLPAAGGAAVHREPGDADASERSFVLYAWPDAGEGLVFAVDARGVIHGSLPEKDREPAWNSLYRRNAGWGGAVDERRWRTTRDPDAAPSRPKAGPREEF
ncbi:MAG: hypothetical protein RLZZ127_2564 [Planctomycetota bacterium]|jgi:hypothetical protein